MEDQKIDNRDKELTLSSAILAPLNAVFEAQVHAARSFLSFILQMGFRHKYTQEDINRLKKTDNPENKKIIDNYEQGKIEKKEIIKLRNKQESNEGLDPNELNRLKTLLNKWDDVISQDFNYVDSEGDEHIVSIPNLALIPVNPLGIEDANVKFEMRISENYEEFETLRKSSNATEDRPWYLIKPKRLSGSIVPKNASNNQSGISIEINIKKTEMPYGLSKFLASVTEASKILEPENTEEEDQENS